MTCAYSTKEKEWKINGTATHDTGIVKFSAHVFSGSEDGSSIVRIRKQNGDSLAFARVYEGILSCMGDLLPASRREEDEAVEKEEKEEQM